jgi:hypothetical protein
MALGEWRTGRRRKERGSSISVGSVWGGAMNPLLMRILLERFDFWPSKMRSKTTTTTVTGDSKQQWHLGKVGRPPCFSCATLARNLKQRWCLGAVSHPPFLHVMGTAAAAPAAAAVVAAVAGAAATAGAAAAVAAQGGSKQ